MRYKIENLQDITDSREIMQSSPNGFSKYMTYIIIALLASVTAWASLAQKEVAVTAAGTVRPQSEVNKFSSNIQGTVTELRIKDGDKVSAGDILVVVNGSEYELQRNLLQGNLDRKNKEMELIKKLKESILDEANKFDSANEDETEYSKKYELFLETINSNNGKNTAIENQKADINKNISNLKLLKKGIEEGKNYFSSGDTLYYQYNNYSLNVKQFNDNIKSCEDNITKLETRIKENESSKSNTTTETETTEDVSTPPIINTTTTQVENQALKDEIENLKNNIKSYNSEKEKVKNSTILEISTQIAQYESSLLQLQTSSNASTYKEQYISNLDSNINSIQSAIDDINMNLEAANAQIETTSIKAASSGVVNMLSNLKVGEYIQVGTQIASIIPEDQISYKLDIYIESNNFGEIKEGQDVAIEFVSLPGSEYGYINSKLENISVDSKVDQEQGKSYYTAACNINEISLNNKKGESVDIKNGMAAQVRIINRKVSYMKYFLEKMDILK